MKRTDDSSDSPGILTSVSAEMDTVDEVTQRGVLLKAALDSFAAAIWVLDRNRHVHFMNLAGRDCIARQDGLVLHQDRLGFNGSVAMARFVQAVQSVCGPARSTNAFCVQGPRFGMPMQVVVSRLIEGLHGAADSTYRALVMATRINQIGCHDEGMRLMFGLSPCETHLLNGLLNGKSLKEYARFKGVACCTVRTQLSSIFNKTNTSSQAQLMAVARALPTSVKSADSLTM